jgi:DMSO reductase anchor subunit
MLVLTQWSVGMFLADTALGILRPPAATAELHAYRAVLAACTGVLALLASTLHLGRPQFAFRALVGLKTSWLSREILMFGLFAGSALMYAALMLMEPIPGRQPHHSLIHVLSAVVLASGAGGVACSVLLYAVTRKQYWSTARTAFRFGSSVLLAALCSALAMTLAENLEPVAPIAPLAIALGWGLIAVGGTKLAWELGGLLHLRARQLGELKRSAVLLVTDLRLPWLARLGLGGFGAILAPLMVVTLEHSGSTGLWPASLASLGAVAVLAGELLERMLFFRAVSGPSMPGGVAP